MVWISEENLYFWRRKTELQMNFFAQFVPQYLLTKRSLTIMVISAAVFAFLFIIIYEPFKAPSWDEIPRFIFVACVLGIVLLGMSIVAISRVIMCYHAKKHRITYLKYGAWVSVELVLMAIAFSTCAAIVGSHIPSSPHLCPHVCTLGLHLYFCLNIGLSVSFSRFRIHA